MKEIIEYLAAILNIKTESDLVVLDMKNELQGIADIVHYQKYMRSNINYLGMEYMTGFQKFVELTKKYKLKYAEDENALRLGKSSSFAKELAERIKSISSDVLDNNDLKYKNFTHDKECIFSSFEQAHLNKIGSLLQCINIQRSISGDDMLFKKLEKNMQQIVINEAIGYEPSEKTNRNISNLISGTVKEMKI